MEAVCGKAFIPLGIICNRQDIADDVQVTSCLRHIIPSSWDPLYT